MNAVAPRSGSRLAALVRGFALVALLALGLQARASDEDMTTSAYLVFDPETGQFVTVHDPDRSRQHAEEQPVAEAAQNGNGATPRADGSGAADRTEGGQSVPAVAAAGVGVALAVAAVFVWFRRKPPKEG
jgi:hypothetical protein